MTADDLWIVSADDHVVEPPDLWSSRLPQRYADVGPRIVRNRAEPVATTGGKFSYRRNSDDGYWCDWWLYEGLEVPLCKPSAAAGFDTVDFLPITFDDMRPGCWKQTERLEDMDLNHVEASVCFPNTLPRFCGQTFAEAQDKELALLCVKAYNDWVIDEWCAGAGHGRLIPVTLVPLWDRDAAVAEVLRCAGKGSYSIAFSENPAKLGLPSVHDAGGYWEPLWAACSETGTVVNMHIGSSSALPTTAPDAPQAVSSTLMITNTMGALVDFVIAGIFERHPHLRIILAEGQAGWIPYTLARMDQVWENRDGKSMIGIDLPKPPSSYMEHVFACIFDDEVGLANRDRIGMDQILFEVDYPHLDSTFPDSRGAFERIATGAGLSAEERVKLGRANAVNGLRLERYGLHPETPRLVATR